MPKIPYASTTQVKVSPPASSAEQGVKQGCPFSPFLFGLYLDALKGRLDGRKCDAPTLVDVHVWLLFFADDLALMSESNVGLQQ